MSRKRIACPVIQGEIAGEQWHPVPGYEGIYSVSDHARVRGEQRQVPGKSGSIRTLPQKLKTPTPDSSGYLQVQLKRGKGVPPQMFKVAHLVALAFLGERPPGMHVCHNNGDKLDNRLANLRYDTPAANVEDRKRHGGFRSGVDVPGAKLTLERAREIRGAAGSLRVVAARFGVSHMTVWDVRNNVRWQESGGAR